MRGSLSTENGRSPSAALVTAEAARVLLVTCAVGVLAGAVTARVRLHLGLPGHKALLWMAPVIVARLVWRSPIGGSAGSLSAAVATSVAGGHLAGSALHLPMVVLAGGVLDVAARAVERPRRPAWWAVPLMGGAGMVANLVMLGKRLLAPLLQFHTFLGTSGLSARCLSYAASGLVAGLVGGVVAWAVLRRGGASGTA